MSESLLGFVGIMVRERLKNEPVRMQETLELVRYCTLLAQRLQLPKFNLDRSAWHAGFTIRISSMVGSPFFENLPPGAALR